MNTKTSALLDWLSKVADWPLSWVYPNICKICAAGQAGKSEGYVCQTCRGKPGAVKQIKEPFCNRCGIPYFGSFSAPFNCGNCGEMELFFRRARAAVHWTPFVREIVHSYKYNRALWHEPFLAELLIERSLPILQSEHWDMIVPIPLHKTKFRKREFNQAERLGRRLSKASGIPLCNKVLKRVAQTQTQTRLNPKERAENVKKAFAPGSQMDVSGARIILLDDVLTTGATANACAKVLKQNGAECVDVWTVARGVLE